MRGHRTADGRRAPKRSSPDGVDEHLGVTVVLGVEVLLELLVLVAIPVIIPLSWDFVACWFASFGGVDQRQPEQGRNRGTTAGHVCGTVGSDVDAYVSSRHSDESACKPGWCRRLTLEANAHGTRQLCMTAI